jgi:hypothetical protein
MRGGFADAEATCAAAAPTPMDNLRDREQA